ncbi:Ppx/GppA phosphatase family protein [Thermotalea metallivorans]|uniref:Guanosine-5'-triphosphate,3'-diphosphate pyrophosphatase n=1 Tax=Thermotalea metallivorans TaxID=520762 RepID=A0A140L087_9FIRM|nr:Ppx/GppA phosphatase family protein [Thermotalea metallivorans]KXG73962.1 Guanosine-5'-triphosphate,3'-diphosphate pyrophosphatase [Thermotalea metallivorans]
MTKLAAIDIGTNSMRLLIARVKDGKIIESFKDLETTRIGENVDKTGRLSIDAMERNIKALEKFVNIVRKERIENLSVIATSAVRDAENREEFLHRARKELGVEIQVISGDREAQLGFLGVSQGFEGNDEEILVLDIGGGSTEFILGNGVGIRHMTSVNVGAVRMTEKYIVADPPRLQEIEDLKERVEHIILPTLVRLKEMRVDRVIGIGGTATTIAAVHKELKVYDREKVHHTELNLREVRNVLQKFMSVSLHERRKIPGLHPKRADVIIAGTIILDRILSLLEINTLCISEYDNLEGLIFEQLGYESGKNI